ncbi:MAG: tetratricopeptide repeat protein [Rhizomicrobium sp.]|jgi:tetratricopeptide (TPR) repeat protein
MILRLISAMGVVAVVTTAQPASADETAPPPASPGVPVTQDAQPWIKAASVANDVQADVASNGIRAVESHVSDMEAALAAGPQAFAAPTAGDGPAYVLTDGTAQTVAALGQAIIQKTGRQTVAVSNPYPLIGLYLGSYYNEIGKYDDALRVLDAAIKLTAVPEMRLGEHLPYLISERGAALQSLKRWLDALADYEDGLKLENLKDRDRARLLRGKGFALTELGSLDDAEQAYNDSLKFDPNNPLAVSELKYIARLRGGQSGTRPQLVLPNAPKSN